jgi:hypothetical protein
MIISVLERSTGVGIRRRPFPSEIPPRTTQQGGRQTKPPPNLRRRFVLDIGAIGSRTDKDRAARIWLSGPNGIHEVAASRAGLLENNAFEDVSDGGS